MLITIARHGRGVEHRFGLCHDGRLARQLADDTTVSIFPSPRLSRPWTTRRTREAARQTLTGWEPDVFVTHSPWDLAVFGPVIARMKGKKLHWLHAPWRRTVLELISGRWLPPVVIGNSRYTLDASNLSPDSVTKCLLHNPVEPPVGGDRASLREELAVSPDTVVILQVARLESWKGQSQLIAALGRVQADTPWECWIVGGEAHGDGYRKTLESSARRLGIGERVRLLGERDDLDRIYASADIFCHPNEEAEPFGVVFVEALYHGLPVIAVDEGGPAEIIDSSCGRLIAKGDVSSLAHALEQMIDDPEMRRELSVGAPHRAAVISDPASQMTKLEDVLRQTVVR